MSIECKNIHKNEYVLGSIFMINCLRAEFAAMFKNNSELDAQRHSLKFSLCDLKTG